MRIEYLKTLWALRFEKIRKNEIEAARAYQAIRNDLESFLKPGDKALELLSQLVLEEQTHEHQAQELLKICHRTHPEYDAPLD